MKERKQREESGSAAGKGHLASAPASCRVVKARRGAGARSSLGVNGKQGGMDNLRFFPQYTAQYNRGRNSLTYKAGLFNNTIFSLETNF